MHLRLAGLALDACGPAHADLLDRPGCRASLERRHLLGGADRDPQPAVGPSLADQHAAIEQALPDRVPVGEACRTARSWRRSRRPRAPARAARSTVGVALGAQVVDAAEQLGGVPQRRERDRLGDRREVVGQPDDAERVADRGVGGQVAEPGAGERERLAHRAGDHQVAVRRQQLERARACRRAGTRRTPRRPPRPRRRAASHSARRPPRAAARCRSGCSGEGSSTTDGRSRLDQRARARRGRG